MVFASLLKYSETPHRYFYLKTIIYKYSPYPSHAHTFHAFFNSGWAGGRTSLLLPAPASASACVYCCSCNSCNLNTYEFQIFYMLKSEVWKCDAKNKIEWAPSSVHPRFLVLINCILIDEMMSCFPYIKLTSTWFDKKRKSKIRIKLDNTYWRCIFSLRYSFFSQFVHTCQIIVKFKCHRFSFFDSLLVVVNLVKIATSSF